MHCALAFCFNVDLYNLFGIKVEKNIEKLDYNFPLILGVKLHMVALRWFAYKNVVMLMYVPSGFSNSYTQ